MNKPSAHVRYTSSFFLVTFLFVAGCGRKDEAKPETAASIPQPGKTTPAPARKNSFQQVTSQLDPGGNLFAYFGTEEWISGLSQQVSSWRAILQAVPDLTEEQRTMANKGFDLATRLLKGSGLEEISGVGMSGIATDQGRYRTKLIVHHYPDRKSGYIWSLFGVAPHSLDGLNQLPTTTGMSVFFDLDLRGLWMVLQRELSQSGIPELEEWSRAFPRMFQEKAGVNFDGLLNSFGGEFGIVLTLDETRKVPLPIPTPQPIEIPEPRLALIVKVKDDTLFEHLDKLMQNNPQVTRVDEGGVRLRTVSLPVPLPFPFRPTIGRAGDYFYFASTDTLIRDLLAVREGKQPGLKSTEEFKGIAQGLPEKGNSFVFISPRFNKAVSELQTGALAASAAGGAEKAAVLRNLFLQGPGGFSYKVSGNTAEGWVSVGNGTSDPSKKAVVLSTMQPAAVVGLLAAIAIPNFVKARQTAQYNAIVNNLRMLEGAKAQWALENRKRDGEPVTERDLEPFLRGGRINPVAGETYQVNPAGSPATATLNQRMMNNPAGSVIKAR
jgi:hypothetical protein